MNDEIWAITTFFNPCGYKSRYENYKRFREHLNIPLLTAELIFNDPPEIQDDDADIVLTLTDGDAMWQRECIVNRAVSSIPKSCNKVVMLDADVFFADPDWALLTSRMLDKCALGQPFKRVYRLPEDYSNKKYDLDSVRQILTKYSRTMKSSFVCRWLVKHQLGGNTGFAWAFQREFLEKHGMHDGSPVGGNDKIMAYTMLGMFDAAIKKFSMNEKRAMHYLEWARPFFEDVKKSCFGYVDVDMYTYFHGSPSDRQYKKRHVQLAEYDFNPHEDLRYGKDGCWRWASDKPGLHEYLREYFYSRKEDDVT